MTDNLLLGSVHLFISSLSGDTGSTSLAILKADLQLDYTNHGRLTPLLKSP